MGFNVDVVYASDNLNAAWLKANGGKLHCKIVDVVLKKFGGEGEPVEQKLALVLSGCEKTLSLNVTNKNILREAFGAETDGWIGWAIVVRTYRTAYMGKPVDGVTIEVDTAAATPVKTMGEAGAKKLMAALTAKNLDLNTLRAVLAEKPGRSSAANSDPSMWNAEWMDDIAAWLKNPVEPQPKGVKYDPIGEDDIPF
jgi:hypothetical protein